MAQKTIRKRRATLRGWWKITPFLAGPVTLLMTFAYWETERLQNQYHRSERLFSIEELRKEIGYLSDHDRELNRIEVMDERAPDWQLREPDPDQIVIVPAQDAINSIDNIVTFQRDPQESPMSTRTVLLHLSYEEEVMAKDSLDTNSQDTDREQVAHETPTTD